MWQQVRENSWGVWWGGFPSALLMQQGTDITKRISLQGSAFCKFSSTRLATAYEGHQKLLQHRWKPVTLQECLKTSWGGVWFLTTVSRWGNRIFGWESTMGSSGSRCLGQSYHDTPVGLSLLRNRPTGSCPPQMRWISKPYMEHKVQNSIYAGNYLQK